jgi:hypothetical protein
MLLRGQRSVTFIHLFSLPSMKNAVLAATAGATLLLLLSGCNEELGPLNGPSGLSGVVRFKNWPPADSLLDMRLIVFETIPRDSARIILTLLAGGAAVYPALGQKFPMFVDSLRYEFTTQSGTNLQLKNYEYIAIVQQYGQNILTDWAPVGIYTTSPDSSVPAPVRVLLHRIVPNIDIHVDFDNPPPKPWR